MSEAIQDVASRGGALAGRFQETARLIRENLAALSPAERDQMLQTYIAQGMTVAQRFRATSALIRFAVSCNSRVGDEHDG